MKKVFSIVLAAAMAMSMAVTVMAGEIQPRNPSCADCGAGTYYEEYSGGQTFKICNHCRSRQEGAIYIGVYVCNRGCGFEERDQVTFICDNCGDSKDVTSDYN